MKGKEHVTQRSKKEAAEEPKEVVKGKDRKKEAEEEIIKDNEGQEISKKGKDEAPKSKKGSKGKAKVNETKAKESPKRKNQTKPTEESKEVIGKRLRGKAKQSEVEKARTKQKKRSSPKETEDVESQEDEEEQEGEEEQEANQNSDSPAKNTRASSAKSSPPKKQKEAVKEVETTGDEGSTQKEAKEDDPSKSILHDITVEGFEGKVIERGQIAFFFQPEDGVTEPKSLDEVQKVYILLRPTDGESKLKARLLLMGAKTMLKHTGDYKDRIHWGFVCATSDKPEQVAQRLEPKDETKTERLVGDAFVAGEGTYEIARLHSEGKPKKEGSGSTKPKDESMFSYMLEIPKEPTSLQTMLNIKKQDMFLVHVKNPKKANVVGDVEKADLQPSKLHPLSDCDAAQLPPEPQQGIDQVDQTKFAALKSMDIDCETECSFIAVTASVLPRLGKIVKELEENESLMRLSDDDKYGKDRRPDKICQALGMDRSENSPVLA